jgi:CheY-like chemotaxis protein
MTKIVVVDDQQVLAAVYRSKFIAEGYEVEVAFDGEQALDLINSARPDLVLLDLVLPKINGVEVLRRLRANPMFQDLPVIVFSSSTFPKMVQEAWDAGASMVLSKSDHSPKEILESVRSALKAASQNQSSQHQSSSSSAAASGSDVTSADLLVSGQPGANTSHVLLVEDHPDVRGILSFLLERFGHQVTAVENHAESLDKVAAETFDLYLINRVCPDGSGLALCHQLRQSNPEPLIVMYSTAAPPAEREAALGAGASVYLATPKDLINIGNVLADLMKGSRTRIFDL